MNFKILILVIVAGIGISSYGVLSNSLTLDIQKFDLVVLPPMDGSTIEGATEFSGVQCSCRDPDDPNGAFDPGFCDVSWMVNPNGLDGIRGTDDDVPGVPDPDSLGTNGNMLCTWEASSSVYGDLLDYDEGCPANYWLKSGDPASTDYSWPLGYQPEYLYEDVFNIALVKDDDQKEKKIDHLKEKIAKFKAKIKELKDQGKIKSQTDRSLNWLLDAIPLNDGDTIVATKKLDSFYDRLDLFEKRGILHYLDKKYILEILEDSDDTESKKFTLLDALSNNVLSPPDKKIVKESVAAILNSAHFQVSYPYSISEIMKMTQDAVQNNNEIKTANEFKKYNLAGAAPLCPYNED